MKAEIALVVAILVAIVFVALGGIAGIAYETQKKTECKKYAIEHKYDYKEIELICK